MGGSGGTSIATTAMRALPVGVPKVMVSTMGVEMLSLCRDQRHYLHASIVDVAGFNSISRTIYATARAQLPAWSRWKNRRRLLNDR
jgi:uncharacterized protein (UPF0261 family)